MLEPNRRDSELMSISDTEWETATLMYAQDYENALSFDENHRAGFKQLQPYRTHIKQVLFKIVMTTIKKTLTFLNLLIKINIKTNLALLN